VSQVWDEVIEALQKQACELKSLYPFQVLAKPDSSPCLVSMRTEAWRDLSCEEKKVELPELLATIGWSAIRSLS
jgi:hypothetical protein